MAKEFSSQTFHLIRVNKFLEWSIEFPFFQIVCVCVAWAMKIHYALKTIIHCWKLERIENWKICQKHLLDRIQEAICCNK